MVARPKPPKPNPKAKPLPKSKSVPITSTISARKTGITTRPGKLHGPYKPVGKPTPATKAGTAQIRQDINAGRTTVTPKPAVGTRKSVRPGPATGALRSDASAQSTALTPEKGANPRSTHPKPPPKPPAKPPAKPHTPAKPGTASTWTSAQAGAQTMLFDQLKKWGIDVGSASSSNSIAYVVHNAIVNGQITNGDPSALEMYLQDTEQWKARFSANSVRAKNGLSTLSPAEYLQMEDGIRTQLNPLGSAFAGKSTIDQLMGHNVSAAEVQARVADAIRFTHNMSPEIKAAIHAWYPEFGNSDTTLAGHFLDPDLTYQQLQLKENAALIGGAATKDGIKIGRDQTEQWLNSGKDVSQLETGLQNAATLATSNLTGIAQRFGQKYTQADALAETIDGSAQAAKKRDYLASQERGLFAGTAGNARLTRNSNTGAF